MAYYLECGILFVIVLGTINSTISSSYCSYCSSKWCVYSYTVAVPTAQCTAVVLIVSGKVCTVCIQYHTDISGTVFMPVVICHNTVYGIPVYNGTLTVYLRLKTQDSRLKSTNLNYCARFVNTPYMLDF
jgi:hypothetical protein